MHQLSVRRVGTRAFLSATFLMFLFSFAALAGPKKLAPLSIDGTVKVDAEKVIELAQNIPNLLVIDARIKMDRMQGYIEGSHSLPDIETSCGTLAKIIPAKSNPVLFYCNGVKCGRSVNSSKIAVKCGYNTIYWFRGGFEEWKQKGLPYVKE